MSSKTVYIFLLLGGVALIYIIYNIRAKTALEAESRLKQAQIDAQKLLDTEKARTAALELTLARQQQSLSGVTTTQQGLTAASQPGMSDEQLYVTGGLAALPSLLTFVGNLINPPEKTPPPAKTGAAQALIGG